MRGILSCLTTLSCLIASSPVLAQFTPEQEAAFTQGAGVSGQDVVLLVSAVTAAVALSGMAWIAYAAFQEWATGRTGAGSVAVLLARASFLLIIVGLFLS